MAKEIQLDTTAIFKSGKIHNNEDFLCSVTLERGGDNRLRFEVVKMDYKTLLELEFAVSGDACDFFWYLPDYFGYSNKHIYEGSNEFDEIAGKFYEADWVSEYNTDYRQSLMEYLVLWANSREKDVKAVQEGYVVKIL